MDARTNIIVTGISIVGIIIRLTTLKVYDVDLNQKPDNLGFYSCPDINSEQNNNFALEKLFPGISDINNGRPNTTKSCK